MSRTMEVGAQKESQEELPGTKNKKNKEKHKTNRNKTTKKDTGGGTNNIVRVFGENVAGRRFRCSGLMTFWKVKKGDQGGAPKMAKIQYGVKLDIFKITRIQVQKSPWT